MTRRLPRYDTLALVIAFAVSGTLHLVRPSTFEPIMPRRLPAHRALIYASGVAELVCAAGLLHPRTRAGAGAASAALLLAVYPANVTMATRSLRSRSRRRQLIAFARLPLQLPLLGIAYRASRDR